jgi:hypothetical protein
MSCEDESTKGVIFVLRGGGFFNSVGASAPFAIIDCGASIMKQTREILLFSVLTFALLVTGKADASCNGSNPPTITSINPSTGSVSGGTVVTISGGSLGCVSVTFGGVSATNVTATGTTVTATSPAGAAGTVDLIVTNPNVGANANATATTQFSYITTASVPTSLVATVGDRQVSVAFTAPTSTGGSSIINYEYQLDGGSWVSASTTSSPVLITGLTNGTSYSIKLRAVNAAGAGAESAAATFMTPSPASEFERYETEIREVIIDEAARSLQSSISVNQRMSRDARDRFVANAAQSEAVATRNNIPFDIDGAFSLSGATLSTNGTFFGQHGSADGTWRRLFFGDFNVQRDGNTGSNTATLSARVAWERSFSDTTMLGYFVGGELARSNIEGAFSGDQNRIGVAVGGYGVRGLSDNLFVDGFVTLGVGRNNLTMANDVLALSSDYTTRTVMVGGTLSGRIEQKGFDIWPELSFSYGRTWIGDVGLTGRAYGLVDDTLSLNAGSVTLANAMFRPEFRIPLDGLQASKSLSLLTFAPRMICEQVKATTTTKNCGSGAEFGIATHSADGLSNVTAKILADRLGNSTKSGLQLNLEHRF